MSFSAFDFANLIFCFNLKLSSNKSFKLCYLSAKSIDKVSLSFINFYKISPHYFPKLHFYFNWLFYYFIDMILYLSLFFCYSKMEIPWESWSYLSSRASFLYSRTLVFQICSPCFNPFFKFVERADRAILIPSSFFSAY